MRFQLVALALLFSCSSGDDDGFDAAQDTGARDASPMDAAAMDAGGTDADPVDAAPQDAADAAPRDAAEDDAGEQADAGPNDAEAADSGTDPDQLPPTNAADLLTWLQAGTYASWAAESGLHASAGPHFGRVRTFVNAALDGSLAANGTEHPAGSAAVKELYGQNGNNVRGWAVMVKTEGGSGGERWWWYERYDQDTFASSQGAGICVPCHSSGIDSFRSPYPLQ